MANLPSACLNTTLTTPEREVWLIDALECDDGDEFLLTFEQSDDRWRQGVWLAVDGSLTIAGVNSPQAVLWHDTAPEATAISVRSARDGWLRLYNIWDSGRGIKDHESQSATSGMLREPVVGGHRYRCATIGYDPEFDALTFTLVRRTD